MNFIEFKSELIDSILLIKSGIQKIVEPIAKSENITPIQLYVLFSIYNEKIDTVGTLSKDFGVNQGNVSTLCKDLEKMGLVVRKRNSEDERVVNLFLTESGIKTISRLDKKFDGLKEQFKDITPDQTTTIVNGIKEFGTLLKSIMKERED